MSYTTPTHMLEVRIHDPNRGYFVIETWYHDVFYSLPFAFYYYVIDTLSGLKGPAPLNLIHMTRSMANFFDDR
jgi:hypothetical protein